MGKRNCFTLGGPRTKASQSRTRSYSIISLVHIWLIQAGVGYSEKFIKPFPCHWIGFSLLPMWGGLQQKDKGKAFSLKPSRTFSACFLSLCPLNSQMWTNQPNKTTTTKTLTNSLGEWLFTPAFLRLRWQRICLLCGRSRFDPWVGEISWRRKWLPTPIFCLENPIDRGDWWATIHSVTKSWAGLSG